ncbi:MAG: serine/threonine kinase [Fibrobacteres bacterium]|nr:serine/threonine kinase [Fibrobacterota bacterium]
MLTAFYLVGVSSAQTPPAGMALIHAKGMTFLMGMDKAEQFPGEPAEGWAFYLGKHKVSFTYDFFLDTVMVTQGAYKALMGNNPSGRNTGDMNLPVEKTTWFDAALYMNARSKKEGLDTVYAYKSVVKNGTAATDLPGLAFDIKKNGYRIPTNAEYEYAERAGTAGKYFFAPDGRNVDALGAEVAWYEGNSGRVTHPVGTRKPNPWGLYDMVGNLFEWCNDWNAPYPLTDEIDPIGAPSSPEKNKVAKGGSFKTDISGHMRIQYHYKWAPGAQAELGAYAGIGEIGFRAARTVTAGTGLGRTGGGPKRFPGTRLFRLQGGVGFALPLSNTVVDPAGRDYRGQIRLNPPVPE